MYDISKCRNSGYKQLVYSCRRTTAQIMVTELWINYCAVPHARLFFTEFVLFTPRAKRPFADANTSHLVRTNASTPLMQTAHFNSKKRCPDNFHPRVALEKCCPSRISAVDTAELTTASAPAQRSNSRPIELAHTHRPLTAHSPAPRAARHAMRRRRPRRPQTPAAGSPATPAPR
jgi:hypothetical protein